MKNKIKFWSVLALIITFFVLGCSKDDGGNSNEPVINGGGSVFRYESVIISVQNINLNQNQYNATFGGTDVIVLKADNNTLTFMVPIDAPLGNNELIISSLNNTKLNYSVLEPILAQSVDDTVAPLISEFETFFTEITTPTFESNLALYNYNQFKNYWDNVANAQEKEQIALWYQTNKVLIDEFFYLNTNNNGGRITSVNNTDTSIGIFKNIVGRFAIVAGVVITGSAVTAATIAAAPVALGVAVIGVGYYLCDKGNKEVLDGVFNGLNASVGGFYGNNNKLTSNEIQLVNDEIYTTSFKIQTKSISQEYSNTTNSLLKEFFTTNGLLNSLINNVNDGISFINSNLSINYQSYNEVSIPSTSTTQEVDVTPEMMQDISFSLDHQNLELISASLASSGQLNLKVKIINVANAAPINSTLNYSYSNEISDFSGSFPITVSSEFLLVGNWDLTEYVDSYGNSYQLNSWVNIYGDVFCPNVWSHRSKLVGSNNVFGPTAFNISPMFVGEDRQINISNCQVESTISSTSNPSVGGYYGNQQGNIVAVDDQISGFESYIEIIDNDTIKFYQGEPQNYTVYFLSRQ